MSNIYGHGAYVNHRRAQILDAVNTLSPDAKADWIKAAERLRLKLIGLSVESALELLVTIYCTDEVVPCRDLPK